MASSWARSTAGSGEPPTIVVVHAPMRNRRAAGSRTKPTGAESERSSVSERNSALSRTERLRQCSLVMLANSEPLRLATAVRPRLGLKPNRPHADAGARIDPPASLACANGTIPAATATALPPDEPSGERDRSHGLSVAPSSSDSVLGRSPNSESDVLPAHTRPACSRRLPYSVCCNVTRLRNKRAPSAQRSPGQGLESLITNGTP